MFDILQSSDSVRFFSFVVSLFYDYTLSQECPPSNSPFIPFRRVHRHCRLRLLKTIIGTSYAPSTTLKNQRALSKVLEAVAPNAQLILAQPQLFKRLPDRHDRLETEALLNRFQALHHGLPADLVYGMRSGDIEREERAIVRFRVDFHAGDACQARVHVLLDEEVRGRKAAY
jgi:hypothetical protein